MLWVWCYWGRKFQTTREKHFLSFCDLKWPQMASRNKFSYIMISYGNLSIHAKNPVSVILFFDIWWPLVNSCGHLFFLSTCKKSGLCVMLLIFYPWWPFKELLWPLMTFYDIRMQTYISNSISSSHLCIHTKNQVSGCFH